MNAEAIEDSDDNALEVKNKVFAEKVKPNKCRKHLHSFYNFFGSKNKGPTNYPPSIFLFVHLFACPDFSSRTAHRKLLIFCMKLRCHLT